MALFVQGTQCALDPPPPLCLFFCTSKNTSVIKREFQHIRC